MSEVVTSLQNKIVKLAASLKSKKKRDESGLFTTEGIRLAEEALHSEWKIDYCLYTGEAKSTLRASKLIASLEKSGCKVIEILPNIYEKISDTEQPQGLMLIVEKNNCQIDEFLGKQSMLCVILDGVQDPGNVGTLIRTADATGCDAVLMTKGCADLFSGKTVRASMGSIFHLPVYTELTHTDIISILHKNKIKLITTSLDSSDVYFEADLTGAAAITFGNEGSGVSEELLISSDHRLYIPMIGKAESLNVSAAAAVILYEAVRQRRSIVL